MPETRLRGEILRNWNALEQLTDDWTRLWRLNPSRQPFQEVPWLRAWYRAFQRSWSINTPIVYDENGRVLAILPLVRQRKQLAFIGHGCADYNDLIAEPSRAGESLGALLDLLLRDPNPWDECLLEHLSEESLLYALLPNLTGRFARRLVRIDSIACPAILLKPDRSEVLSKAINKDSLRRHRRLLERRGTLVFRHIEQREDIERHLPEFIRQHVRRRALVGDRSLFLDGDMNTFFRGLVAELDPKNTLRFSVLSLGDRPIAYHLGFQCARKYVWYKPTFDLAFWDESPGEVLFQSLLGHLQETNILELDFTIGDEAFKSRFANIVRSNHTVALHRSELAAAARRTTIALRGSVHRKPALRKILQAVRRALTSAPRRITRVLAREGLSRAALLALRQVTRSWVFAYDEVQVYHSRAGIASRSDRAPSSAELEVDRFSLGLVAEAALEYPEYLTPEVLRQFRTRVKRGELGFMAFRDGRLVHLAWVGHREEIVAETEIGPQCRLSLENSGHLIYDCWTPPWARGSGVYTEMLKTLCRIAVPEGKDVWIHCERGNTASRIGIEKAGFTLTHRFQRRQWLGLISQYSVTAADRMCGSDLRTSGQPPAGEHLRKDGGD